MFKNKAIKLKLNMINNIMQLIINTSFCYIINDVLLHCKKT